MSEQIEIEYKNLLTKEEYDQLLEHFQISNIQIKRQQNHYFDTTTFSLKELNTALRLREKAEFYELTIKQPAMIGLLETNQTISKLEATKFLEQGILPEGDVKNKLSCLPIQLNEIDYFGTLITDRVEFPYKGGTLVLDHSHYLSVNDYEIEYEVTIPVAGEQIFLQLLATFNIPNRKTENKVQRFYQQKFHEK